MTATSPYRQAVITCVTQLKRLDRFDRACAHLLPCAAHDGYLLPVCDLHRDDAHLIGLLAQWREENSHAFPSQFPVTHAGTARWLNQGILDNPGRMLFLVCTRFGQPVGHVGVADYLNDAGSMEAENIVRGVTGTAPGLMTRAMQTLIAWARALGAHHLHLRVFSDNAHAVDFYRKLGFRDAGLIALRKHVEGPAVVYRPREPGDGATPDKHFLQMVLP